MMAEIKILDLLNLWIKNLSANYLKYINNNIINKKFQNIFIPN